MGNSSLKWWIIAAIIGFVLVLSALRQRVPETRLQISKLEAVTYSGTATDKEARALAQALQKLRYFQGDRPADVLLLKDPQGTIVSFVVKPDGWEKRDIENEFRVIGEEVATALGITPITLRLVDQRLRTKREFSIRSTRP
jgi:hypothetical protein